MTTTFDTIIEMKKAAIIKVAEGLQELLGQPTFQDEDLRKCTSPELVYLITLQAQADGLKAHATGVLETIFNAHSRVQTTKEVLTHANKLPDSIGGASFGW